MARQGAASEAIGATAFLDELTAAFQWPLNTGQIGAIRELFIAAIRKDPEKQVRRLSGVSLQARTAPRAGINAEKVATGRGRAR